MNLAKLNFFRTRSTDPAIIRQQILTTRLFILLFTIALIILLIYTSISERIQIKTIQHPSLATFQWLIVRYPNTLQCPCQQISILPSHFVTTTPSFHQVCSSDFISQSWIDFTFVDHLDFIYPMDIRTFLSSLWQMIASLCRSAANTITDALADFANEPMISSQASSQILIEAQIQGRLENARRLASEHFIRDLMTIQTITQINGLMTGIMTNFYTILSSIPAVTGYTETVVIMEQSYIFHGSENRCRCLRDQSCQVAAGLYLLQNTTYNGYNNLNLLVANMTVAGIVFDCLPALAAFASSLECFYNRSCIDMLQYVYAKSINVSILDNTQSSRFSMSMPLRLIIEELFLENIVNSTSYSAYYDQCAPISCTYRYSQRFDYAFIIATLLGLIGGLNTALRLIARYLIKLYLLINRKCFHHTPELGALNNGIAEHGSEHPPSICQTIWIKIKQMLIKFNIFSNNPYHYIDDHQGRLATRVYLLLMTVLLITLIIYTDQSIQTFTITLQSPSQSQYEHLQQLYSDSLRCPCSNISIPYGDFLQVTPTYHQLCSSTFVQPDWYRSLHYAYGFVLVITFLAFASSYFQALAFFCLLANDTFNAAYDRFRSTSYIHGQVIPRLSFMKQMNALIQAFLETSHDEFLYTISLLDDLLHVDQYVSGLETNTYFRLNYVDNQSTSSPYRVYPIFKTYNDAPEYRCHCGIMKNCMVINDSHSIGVNPIGISIGCTLLDTTLKSSLACWFDHLCFVDFTTYIGFFSSDLPTNVSLLNSTAPSRFLVNDTMESIVNEMMIEYYNTTVTYEHYYDKCHPLSCTYTYEEKSNLIYVVTTIIGLVGGLNVILRLVSPLLVKLYFRQQQWRRDRAPAAVMNISDYRPQPLHGTPSSFTLLIFRWKNRIWQLNLFTTGSTDMNILRQERISTRIYLLLLSISITIIVICTIVPTIAISKTVDSPLLPQYQDLFLQHGSSLSCPCSQISIPYRDLLTINGTYHQICSSDLVAASWISNITYTGDDSLLQVHDDFRVTVGVYFRILSVLCARAQAAVDKVTDDFSTKTLLSSSFMPEFQFSSRMTDVTNQFQESATSGFSRMIQMLRDYLHGNTFLSSYDLNWYFSATEMAQFKLLLKSPIILNNSCSCGTRSDCTSSQPFLPWLPGLVMGCSVMEGVMRSRLVSFYNQTLLDNIVTAVHGNSSRESTAKSLNASLQSRYDMNTLVHDLSNNLFVEKWSFNASYISFYDRCNPRYCSYVMEERNNALFVVSRILGLYGGLTVSCRLIVVYSIKLWAKLQRYLQNRHVAPF